MSYKSTNRAILYRSILSLFIYYLCCLRETKSRVRNCFDGNDGIMTVEITNFMYEHSYELVDNQTLELALEVSWDIENPNNVALDGLAVRFKVSETSNILFPLSTCHSGDNHMWVNTSDSNACNETDIPICAIGIVSAGSFCFCPQPQCSLFYPTRCKPSTDLFGSSGNHVSILPYTRRLKYRIDFNTAYQIDIVPYRREFANIRGSFVRTIEKFDDCISLVQEREFLSMELAHGLCCKNGVLNLKVQNVTAGEPIPNFIDDTRNVTFTWFPPGADSNVTSYSISIISIYGHQFMSSHTNIVRETLNSFDSTNSTNDTCVYNPKYRDTTTIYGLKEGSNYTLTILPYYSNEHDRMFCGTGTRCLKVVYYFVPFIKRCEPRYEYCDPAANCSYRNDSAFDSAFCVCGAGYRGDGFNESIGEGCLDRNYCQDNKTCVSEAICTDLPAPAVGSNCSCIEGFQGDGFINGTGCTMEFLHDSNMIAMILAIAITIPLIFIIIVIALALVYIKRKRREREALFSKFVVPSGNGIINLYYGNESLEHNNVYDPTFGTHWEIDRKRITIEKVIGRGNYGLVHLGYLKQERLENREKENSKIIRTDDVHVYENPDVEKEQSLLDEKENSIQVAVKQLHDASKGTEYAENLANFLAEIGSMLSIGPHESIVTIYGCCTRQEPVYLVTEYLFYGDLLHFLWDARDSSNGKKDPVYKVCEMSLCAMAVQVIRGLEYLEKMRIIHGDIAARNILVGREGCCKISDFGLANDIYRYGAIKGHTEKLVPYKWISPERMMAGGLPITSKSDIWSFGNLLYEMFTLGCSPHSGIEPDALLEKLRAGYRMPQPATCNDEIYSIMKSCWRWRASSRPSASALVKILQSTFAYSSHKTEDIAAVVEELDKEKYDEEVNITRKLKSMDWTHGNTTFEHNEDDMGQTTV